MSAYLSLVLHAHLPFVRHPEHEKFLEESWLFEAITETYIPLLQRLDGWARDGMKVRLTLTLTPTLCSMLLDPLLRSRYEKHLNDLIELAEKEVERTRWEKAFNDLALFYRKRFAEIQKTYTAWKGDLVEAFRQHQEAGRLEIITSAATHAMLPLLADHPPSLRAQIFTACDHYRDCFGREPRGIWLPECAYSPSLDTALAEANLRWFITDTHGVIHAEPRPRYAIFTPILTSTGVAAFGREPESARQVWSHHEGYPGDPNYRDFYRDIGFDLDLGYVQSYLPAPNVRGFTGIKYHAIIGRTALEKEIYQRPAALKMADQHATQFLAARLAQVQSLGEGFDRPPLMLAPYDAELFGHWWYEGPEFLDLLVRKTYYDQKEITLITPEDYLARHPTNQVATPAASSWGEEGHLRVWLNEKNEWIYPHLRVAQERMTELVGLLPQPDAQQQRGLKQAARELLLAQASDWPFILRTGTSPDYARKRVESHLMRFTALYDQLTRTGVDEEWLAKVESIDNVFPDVNPGYWA